MCVQVAGGKWGLKTFLLLIWGKDSKTIFGETGGS